MTDITTGIKGNAKNLAAWAKKNPALAILIVGGVVLLAVITARSKTTRPLSDQAAEGGLGVGDDVLGGLSGGGIIDYPSPPALGEIIAPYVAPDVTTGKASGKAAKTYSPYIENIPSGTIYPTEEEDDKEFYKERSIELEALAGEQTDPTIRGMLADAARWYGIASMPEEQQLIKAYPWLAPNVDRGRSQPVTRFDMPASEIKTGHAPTTRRRKTATDRDPFGTPSKTSTTTQRRKKKQTTPPQPETRHGVTRYNVDTLYQRLKASRDAAIRDAQKGQRRRKSSTGVGH